MFALSETELRSRILGCGDGPASFNAEATRRGSRVVSCDPIYRLTAGEIRSRIDETCAEILEQTRSNMQEFVWDNIPSIEALGDLRMSAMLDFLEDYDAARSSNRYVVAELPDLPFDDQSFDLVLCSHFLFLYTAQLSVEFHCSAALEMCRVAGEVRIFPLLALGGQPSPHVEPVADALRQHGCLVSIEQVKYEFQRGGNQMMRIRRPMK